ncbi:nitrate reductase molybdenum cofactor assembly chaperone [Nocardioides sp. KR10-350]|uniref:nitrate reductase molybdenum cofactor assembly chaperone n=1 Tax=Nocardioides cheoyonin TaxID=3156615 RepID=UPI0032B5547C
MRRDWRVVHQVAAWCLGYPDDRLHDQLPLLRSALAEQQPSEPVARLDEFLGHLAGTDRRTLVGDYVELFDLSRKQTLYLSYWTDGDTRRRGETLTAFKQAYRRSGWLVDTGGELPDHLPLVLEFAALADPKAGARLLLDHRAALELIRLALEARGTPYALVLQAVCGTLPGPSPQDRYAAMALSRSGPPSESVGLEPLPYPTVRPGGR